VPSERALLHYRDPVAKTSAGLLLYRHRGTTLEVLIGHMGGPFWAGKDERAWSIPKGEYGPGEPAFDAAIREFEEEIGSPPPPVDYRELGQFRQPNGKWVAVWVAAAEFDPSGGRSNTFAMEWPRGSGRLIDVPEMDRAEWVDTDAARAKLVRGQVPVLDALLERVTGTGD
jgi:predicted NUDIX family NTP pyrophosphohydrolase